MLTTKKLADFLGVSTKTIYRIEKKGLLQSIRTPGGQRRFPYSAIKNYISKCKNNNYSQKLNHLMLKEEKENYLLDKEELDKLNIDNKMIQLEQLLSSIPETKEIKNENHQNLINWLEEWDYKSNDTNTYTHGFHTYPAKFIPQIARKLILAFSKEYDTVCDIFCGTGTTLVESSLLNRNSIGIELNPLAVLIAKVKTMPLDPETLIKKLKEITNEYKSKKNSGATTLNFKNIDFWFRNDVIKDLSKLRQIISDISEENIRNFFLVCFSEVIRYSSFTKDSEFKLVRSENKINGDFKPDIIGKFIEISQKNIIGMKKYVAHISHNVFTKVILGDATKDNGIPPNSVDYIITSPPYGDSRTTVAYGQFSRLSSQWLGLLPENDTDIDSKLLGGKNSVNLNNSILNDSLTLNFNIKLISEKDEKRAKEVLSFYIDLNKALIEAYKILKPKKYFTLIVGNRTVKDITLKTDMIICELAEKIGFSIHSIFYRNIPNKRMPIKNSPSNEAGKTGYTMTRESIVTLRKN